MKLHFRKMGEGTPLVILHGLFGSSDNWQTLGKQFADHFEVYLVDQRNHGHSPWSDEAGYEAMVNDLHELLTDEGITRCSMIGHSMGGKTVMEFAQFFPEYLISIVIADIAPKAYPPHHDQIVAALKAVHPEQMATRKEAERRMEELLPDTGTKQFLLKNLYWNDQQQLAWRINIPALERALPEIIGAVPDKQVSVPALFLRGERSGYILDSDFDEIHRLFPASQVKTIAGAGHWLHAEKPQEFFKMVMDFLVNNTPKVL